MSRERKYVLCWRDETKQIRLFNYDTMTFNLAKIKMREYQDQGNENVFICKLVEVKPKKKRR